MVELLKVARHVPLQVLCGLMSEATLPWSHSAAGLKDEEDCQQIVKSLGPIRAFRKMYWTTHSAIRLMLTSQSVLRAR